MGIMALKYGDFMSETCHYNNDECKGELCECVSCGELFCQAHWYEIAYGLNIECVACESARENKGFSKKISHASKN